MNGDTSDNNISAEDRKLRDYLLELSRKLREWDEAPYDGVLGKLPKWIPENFHRDFRGIRGKLLDTYSHDELLSFIAEASEAAECFDNDEKKPTNSRTRIPVDIVFEILKLATFQRAEKLGKEPGLALLTDADHAAQAIQGKKFRDGRKPGTIGPVRKFIRATLKKNPAFTNSELWAAIVKRPPRGWNPMDNPRHGRYIEPKHGVGNVSWRRFCNIASEERKR